MLAVDKDGVPWIGEQIVRDALASVSAGTSAVLPDFADALLGFMNRGQYIFTSKELENATGYPSSRVNKLISMMREKRILVNVGMTGVRANYTFGNCGVDLKECYDSTVIGTIQELTGAVYSAKDRRMGIALENGLTLGTVTQDDYEKMGEGDKWDSDMKLAEQMGIVRRISKECCQILFISMEDLAVFRKGIVPLFKVDICLSLEQMKIEVVRFLGDLGIQDLERVAPLLTGLRRGKMNN